MLDFSSQYGVILIKNGPVYTYGQLQIWVEEELIARRQWGSARGLGDHVEGTRVDSTIMSISSKEFWKGVTEVVADEGGDDIFIA